MLLAAGALSALAFAALPALASAGEYEAHCIGFATCTGTVAGGAAELETDGGEVITCSSVGGNTSFTTTSTTGTANLTFTGCREHITFFTFQCNSSGLANGTIHVNNLTYHLVNLEHSGTVPGVKFTDVSVTFECTGFAKRTVTGSVVGALEAPANFCNKAVASHKVTFEEGATTGTQKYTQITTTGTQTDLVSNSHTAGHPDNTYTTSAQKGTGTITWNHNVEITC